MLAPTSNQPTNILPLLSLSKTMRYTAISFLFLAFCSTSSSLNVSNPAISVLLLSCFCCSVFVQAFYRTPV